MIIWTSYMQYRAKLRRFDLAQLEQIMTRSTERYYDTETGRVIVVGHHDNTLVLIPCDINESGITPVTVHATTRQQINFRIKTGRLTHE